jgi:hypothetical protein
MSLYRRGRIWWGVFTAKGYPKTQESSGTNDRKAARTTAAPPNSGASESSGIVLELHSRMPLRTG